MRSTIKQCWSMHNFQRLTMKAIYQRTRGFLSFWPLLPFTDSVPPSTKQWCPALTQYHQLPTASLNTKTVQPSAINTNPIMIQYTASSPSKSTVSQRDEVIFSLKHFNPPEMEWNSETTFFFWNKYYAGMEWNCAGTIGQKIICCCCCCRFLFLILLIFLHKINLNRNGTGLCGNYWTEKQTSQSLRWQSTLPGL